MSPNGANRPSSRKAFPAEDRRSRPEAGGAGAGGAEPGQGGEGAERPDLEAGPRSEQAGPQGGGGGPSQPAGRPRSGAAEGWRGITRGAGYDGGGREKRGVVRRRYSV